MDGLGAESDEFAFVLSLSRCFCYILSVCFCGATGEKKAPVRSSAHNNICEEAKHIDILPERSKPFSGNDLLLLHRMFASFWENAPCSTRNTPFFGWKNLRLAPKSLLLHSISSCPEEEGVSKCKANCSFLIGNRKEYFHSVR